MTENPDLTAEMIAKGVKDGGAWKGPTTKTWVARIAKGSTPNREYAEDGSFRGWINPHLRDKP